MKAFLEMMRGLASKAISGSLLKFPSTLREITKVLGKLLILCGFILTLWSGHAAAQDLSELKAVLQRGDSNTRIRISFSVLSLDAPDFTTFEIRGFNSSDGVDMLTKFLDICIFEAAATDKKCTESQAKVRYANNNNLDTTPNTAGQFSDLYSASFIDGSTQFVTQGDDISIRKLTAVIEIRANSTKPFSLNTAVSLRLQAGRTANSSNAKDLDTKATIAVAVNDIPKDVVLGSSKGTLSASWTKENQVVLADNQKASPNGVLGFALAFDDWGARKIPIQTYNKDDPSAEVNNLNSCVVTETSDTTCQLECIDNGGAPIGDSTHYLQGENLKAAGFDVLESGSSNSLQISGLSKDIRYAVILQYQPDGLKQSCYIGSPSDAVTLSELSGGAEPTLKDPRCFIATAAYGSPLDPHLETLRWFRDHILLESDSGRSFVKAYYQLSPPIAAYIAESPSLRALTRTALWLPVFLIESWREQPSLLLILVAMSGAFFLLLLRRCSLRALA
jgi:hypothetical protein